VVPSKTNGPEAMGPAQQEGVLVDQESLGKARPQRIRRYFLFAIDLTVPGKENHDREVYAVWL
jgi:hypothetical protein